MKARDLRWCGVLAVLMLGCGADAVPVRSDATVAETRETVVEPAARWETALSEQPGAFTSVWGLDRPNELWLVGADAGDGDGALLVRGTAASGWERIDLRPVDPAGGHLWWAFGAPIAGAEPRDVWLVGEEGRILRVARADLAVRRVESGTDATLYGIWGASEAELWAVGGYVHPRTGPPTILRLKGGAVERVALPAGLVASGTFFKVWGAAADDVWVVGERGMVLHWDGARWLSRGLTSEPRLVTVHGRSARDLVTVGGAGSGVILEGDDFVAEATDGLSPLNGVFVAPGGDAWAVGMLGQVLRRIGPTASWQAVATGMRTRDWHAVWVDAGGDVWVVGGNLLSGLDQGTVARFGPARHDLPHGEVRGLEPIETPEASEPIAAEVTESPDVEIVEHGETTADIAVEVVEDSGAEAEMSDSGPEASDGDDVGDSGSDAADTDGDASAAVPFEIGRIDWQSDVFNPYPEHAVFDLVHGPQGGIHVELAVQFACTTEATELITGIEAHLRVDGVEQARFLFPDYPVPVIAPGLCRSYLIALLFDIGESAMFVGRTAHVTVTVKPPGQSWERTIDGVMVDTF